MTTINFEILNKGNKVVSAIELETNKSIKFYAKIKNEFHYLVSDSGMKLLKKQYNCILKTVENY